MKKHYRKPNAKLLSLEEKLSTSLDLPCYSIHGVFRLEMSGNHEAVIEGCKGILQYDEDTIRLNTGLLVVRFCGTDLSIPSMQSDQTIIRGQILSIDFTS